MNYVINEINRLSEKFGEEFNWGTLSNGSTYVNELQKETDMSVYNEIKAIARSYSSDDVLFILDNNIYRIYHMTYSSARKSGYPVFIEFSDGIEAVGYITKQYIEEYCH